ncbi:hypothetical protein [Halomonas sp. A11-A]|uniref:hypothetical protein n=1 Tax=Halomonas sp. A11-A TaxID=2183985 RepID=UPI0015E85267|nr:hypothetical protein [Halomonas sp. A11-A]
MPAGRGSLDVERVILEQLLEDIGVVGDTFEEENFIGEGQVATGETTLDTDMQERLSLLAGRRKEIVAQR